jgi:hypothetical protein
VCVYMQRYACLSVNIDLTGVSCGILHGLHKAREALGPFTATKTKCEEWAMLIVPLHRALSAVSNKCHVRKHDYVKQ